MKTFEQYTNSLIESEEKKKIGDYTYSLTYHAKKGEKWQIKNVFRAKKGEKWVKSSLAQYNQALKKHGIT